MSRKRLREDSPKTYNISDFDPSYKTINHLLSYRLDLLFFLHNLSCIPVMHLEEGEDSNLIEYNKILLQIHLQLQAYVMQQYILTTATTKLMESVLDYISAQLKMDEKEQKSISASLEVRGGGLGLAKMFVYFACLTASFLMYSDNSHKHGEEYLSLAHTTYNVYDRDIGQTLVEKHKSSSVAVIMKDQSNKRNKSPLNKITNTLNIEKALEKRNIMTEKRTSLWKRLVNGIYKIIPTAEEEMEKYVQDYNGVLSQIGNDAGDVCTQIMKMAYNNNVFLNFRFMHEVESIEKKYKQLQEEKKEYMETLSENKSKTLISSLFAMVTGDVYTPTSYLMNLASSWNADPGNVLSKDEIKTISNVENFAYNEELSDREKENISKSIYKSSSQYCIQSFGMELVYKNNEIQLVGDKINLLSMMELLETIKSNIHVKKMTYEGEEKRKQIHESLKQKFDALTYIAERLNDMATFEMYNILKRKTEINVEDPISSVYNYLNKEANKLDELVKLANMEFPKDEQEKLEIQKANTAFMDIQREYTKEEMRITKFQSEQIKLQAAMDAELFRARMDSFTQIYLSSPVYSFMRSATNIASQIVKAPVIEGSYQIYDTIRTIFREILKEGDAASYIILSGMMLTLVFMMSVVTHTINAFVVSPITKSAKMTVMIATFPFRVVFKIVKMSAGLIQTDAITIYDSSDKAKHTNNLLTEGKSKKRIKLYSNKSHKSKQSSKTKKRTKFLRSAFSRKQK